jgi:hypothetical protein
MVSKRLETEPFERQLRAKAREVAGLGESEAAGGPPYAQLAPTDATGSVDPASAINMGILRDIDYALERIRQGDYGVCEDCGNEIPEDRLRAVPWARQCFDCESLREESA